MDATITLGQYLNKRKTFVIPSYQRGYIWGKKHSDGSADSVTYMLGDLISRFRAGQSVFLQGVTVTETDSDITLIDGQQRTTFLYLLLKFIGCKEDFKLFYAIRNESNKFLNSLTAPFDLSESADIEFQDQFYFIKTLKIISRRFLEPDGIKTSEYEDFGAYLLRNVKFLYINIPAQQAQKVFTMMNGSRARMLPQEIIKAELLRLASHQSEDFTTIESEQQYSIEWELNMLRSRYAREWDKWVHWWNRKEVQRVFNISSLLGWLLIAVMPKKCKADSVSFDEFCNELLKNEQNSIAAKRAFDRLRRAQKRFEDVFNNPIRHNKVGAVLRIINDKTAFIKYYFGERMISDSELNKYYLCRFLNLTHDEILGKTENGDKSYNFEEILNNKYHNALKMLKMPFLFEDDAAKEFAFQTLLRFNIDEDNLQNQCRGRKFDFSIWTKNARSLEHIYPKSKVFHQDETGTWLRGDNKQQNPVPGDLLRNDIGTILDPVPEYNDTNQDISSDIQLKVTEHCIGNIVLLYRDDNSAFQNSDFYGKKRLFLIGENRKKVFKSRHLLHTIYRFANNQWGAAEIRDNFRQVLVDFAETYKTLIDNGK